MPPETIRLDVMGMRCPIPVQRIRMAIRDNPGWEQIELVGDDPESLHDIPALALRMGLSEPVVTEVEGGWAFSLVNGH